MTGKLYIVSIEDMFSHTIIASMYCKTSNQSLNKSVIIHLKKMFLV